MIFVALGVAHLAFGLVALVAPRFFFQAAPPWPPLHVGQIQIAAVFDLTLGVLFLGASRDVLRFGSLAVTVGIVAEWGHGAVRLGHVALGDNPKADLFLPLCMLVAGIVLLALGRRAKII